MARKVKVYSKENCGLCEQAKGILTEIQREVVFEIEEIDIYQDEKLLEAYQLLIPVIEIEHQQIGCGIIHKNDIRRQILHFFN